jgi:hypothetical protein
MVERLYDEVGRCAFQECQQWKPHQNLHGIYGGVYGLRPLGIPFMLIIYG